MARGWVYVITNLAMPGLVKVGYTLKDPILRAQELNHTGAPHPYAVYYDVLVHEPRALEQKLHHLLLNVREGKEWFRLTPVEAARKIRETAGTDLLLEHGAIDEADEVEAEDFTTVHEADSYKNICEFAGCELQSEHVFNDHRYCLWHFREIRNPRKALSIRLLREEQERALGKVPTIA